MSKVVLSLLKLLQHHLVLRVLFGDFNTTTGRYPTLHPKTRSVISQSKLQRVTAVQCQALLPGVKATELCRITDLPTSVPSMKVLMQERCFCKGLFSQWKPQHSLDTLSGSALSWKSSSVWDMYCTGVNIWGGGNYILKVIPAWQHNTVLPCCMTLSGMQTTPVQKAQVLN